MDQCSKNTEACAGMIKEMFNGVFTGRFRDYDPQIRAGCMAAVSNWMLEYPFMFLTDFYLKYLGWSMNDKSSLVRLEVLKGLRRLYADGTKASIMDGFTNRFSARIKELLFDADPMVTCEAIFVVSQLREYETYDADTMNEVLHLLTEENESVRVTAAKVLPKMLPSLLDQYNKTRTERLRQKEETSGEEKSESVEEAEKESEQKRYETRTTRTARRTKKKKTRGRKEAICLAMTKTKTRWKTKISIRAWVSANSRLRGGWKAFWSW